MFTYDTSKELVSKPAANSGGAFGGKKCDLIPFPEEPKMPPIIGSLTDY